jgi:tRNA (mo5U34)-methyltransferase
VAVTLQSAGGPGLDGAIRRLGPWFHNLHLPGGHTTAPDHPLGDFPRWKWDEIGDALPADLRGARALDIGCNAGFYSFELARRGASVVAIDHDPHYLAQAEWAAALLGLGDAVELREMGVYDLHRLHETFDVVLFLGVLYHLRYPLLGLDLVAERVHGTLLLQTLTMPGGTTEGVTPGDLPLDERARMRDDDWPVMAFVEHHLAGDHTNWWAPAAGTVEAMIRTTGLRVVARPAHEFWVCERERPTYHAEELLRATQRSASGPTARTASSHR